MHFSGCPVLVIPKAADSLRERGGVKSNYPFLCFTIGHMEVVVEKKSVFLFSCEILTKACLIDFIKSLRNEIHKKKSNIMGLETSCLQPPKQKITPVKTFLTSKYFVGARFLQ